MIKAQRFLLKNTQAPNPLHVIDLPKALQYFVIDTREGKNYAREHLVVGIATFEGEVQWLYLADEPSRHVKAMYYHSAELAEIA